MAINDFVISVADLSDPLTTVDVSNPTHRLLSETELSRGQHILIGRPFEYIPDICLPDNKYISKKQGRFVVLGQATDGVPIVTYKDHGANRPTAYFKGPHSESRKERLTAGEQIRIYPGDQITIGEPGYHTYSLSIRKKPKPQS